MFMTQDTNGQIIEKEQVHVFEDYLTCVTFLHDETPNPYRSNPNDLDPSLPVIQWFDMTGKKSMKDSIFTSWSCINLIEVVS